jgi:hypothetical protein
MSLFLALVAAGSFAPLPENSKLLPKRQVRLLVADFGDCMVKREARLASQAILANEPGSLMRQYPRLVQDSCIPIQGSESVEVTFSGNQYRYAIAEALVRRELATLPAPSFDDLPALTHGPDRVAPVTDGRGRPLTGSKLESAMSDYRSWQAARYMWRFGECVARFDPAASRQLLLASPESAEEAASFAALGTALGTCLGEGRKIALGKADLRGTIAVNYYRLAHAALRSEPK